MRTGCNWLAFLCENIQHYKSIAILFDVICTHTVRFVGNMKALSIILAISLLLLASNVVDARWHWRGPRFSYGRYLDNYYNYFLPAYYSNFGYGKRSVDHNQQPTANAAN
uniref:Uncharacterized protein n=1 Tax=Ascaris lumbricoides TaxID=6252 RepID=A0A0M3IE73_ASCLU